MKIRLAAGALGALTIALLSVTGPSSQAAPAPAAPAPAAPAAAPPASHPAEQLLHLAKLGQAASSPTMTKAFNL